MSNLNNYLKNKTAVIFLTVILTTFLASYLVMAFSEPTSEPPDCPDCFIPIHTGPGLQTKKGALALNVQDPPADTGLVVAFGKLGVNTGSIVAPAYYLDVNGDARLSGNVGIRTQPSASNALEINSSINIIGASPIIKLNGALGASNNCLMSDGAKLIWGDCSGSVACPASGGPWVNTNLGFCIQKDESSATAQWRTAMDNCANFGAKLCNYQEWYVSCLRAAALGLTNMTNANNEWISDWDNYVSPNINTYRVGQGSCTFINNVIHTDYGRYRCCADTK